MLLDFEQTKEALRDYVRGGILDGWYWHDATGQLVWELNFVGAGCESFTQARLERWLRDEAAFNAC